MSVVDFGDPARTLSTTVPWSSPGHWKLALCRVAKNHDSQTTATEILKLTGTDERHATHGNAWLQRTQLNVGVIQHPATPHEYSLCCTRITCPADGSGKRRYPMIAPWNG